MSAFTKSYPLYFTAFHVLSSRTKLEASLYAGSVSGNNLPISPIDAAPRIASIKACISTSASECPKRPFSKGILTPPKMRALPSTSLCTSKPFPILVSKTISSGVVILIFASLPSTSDTLCPKASAILASSVKSPPSAKALLYASIKRVAENP